MWKGLIKGGIIGGAIVFIWLAISWMILPLHDKVLLSLKDEGDVINCVLDEAPRDGVYLVPRTTESAQKHPNIALFITVRRAVQLDNMINSIICSLLTQIVGAFLISYLLFQTKVLNYWHRVRFVTITGLTVGILGVIPGWTWFGFSGSYVFIEILDYIIGWFLAGLAMSKLVKR